VKHLKFIQKIGYLFVLSLSLVNSPIYAGEEGLALGCVGAPVFGIGVVLGCATTWLCECGCIEEGIRYRKRKEWAEQTRIQNKELEEKRKLVEQILKAKMEISQ